MFRCFFAVASLCKGGGTGHTFAGTPVVLVTCTFRVSCFCCCFTDKGGESTTFLHTVLRQPQPRILAVICSPLQRPALSVACVSTEGQPPTKGLEGAAMRPGRGLVFGFDRRPDPTCQTDLCGQTLVMTPMPYSTIQRGMGGPWPGSACGLSPGGRNEESDSARAAGPFVQVQARETERKFFVTLRFSLLQASPFSPARCSPLQPVRACTRGGGGG